MSENFVYLGDGERLDTFLSKNIPQFTRSYIKKLIDEGKILVEGKKVKAGYELKNGTDISVDYVTPSEPSAKPENIDIDIVYEDDDLAVINKPYGMVVHPCTTTPEHTLVNALLYKMNKVAHITQKYAVNKVTDCARQNECKGDVIKWVFALGKDVVQDNANNHCHAEQYQQPSLVCQNAEPRARVLRVVKIEKVRNDHIICADKS